MATGGPDNGGVRTDDSVEAFIRGLPKTDLHVHLEGSIEPQLMLDLAARNGVKLRWNTAGELQDAYQFQNLQSFLDLYFEGCKVLVTQQDFLDMTLAYLRRAHKDGVVCAELFIGPQSFTAAGTPIDDLMSGVLTAIEEARDTLGISAGLIISVHRHRTEPEAMAVLDQIMPWKDRIIGIGMGGAEVGNPPSKFANFFQAARDRGFRTTIHAGEEGPAAYVREALEQLKVERIDHGITCMEDAELVRELVSRRVPLTVCPVSNLRLQVVKDMSQHPLRAMVASGLHVTVNSDDPPYFGAYVTENFLALHHALNLSPKEIVQLVRNGLEAAWITPEERRALLMRLDAYVAAHGNILASTSSS